MSHRRDLNSQPVPSPVGLFPPLAKSGSQLPNLEPLGGKFLCWLLLLLRKKAFQDLSVPLGTCYVAQDKLLSLSEPQPPHLTTVAKDTSWGACRNLVRQNVGMALANSEAPLTLGGCCDMVQGGVSPGGFKFMMLIQEQARSGLRARNPE